MVLGYFEDATQSNSRIFLNYEDFYPEEPLPPYFINCDFVTAPPTIIPGPRSPLAEVIDSGEYVYVRDNENTRGETGPLFVARRI